MGGGEVLDLEEVCEIFLIIFNCYSVVLERSTVGCLKHNFISHCY